MYCIVKVLTSPQIIINFFFRMCEMILLRTHLSVDYRWKISIPLQRICGPSEQSFPFTATGSISSRIHILFPIGQEGSVPSMNIHTAAASGGLSPAFCPQLLRKGLMHIRFFRKPTRITGRGMIFQANEVLLGRL